jgi:hypothetical protein
MSNHAFGQYPLFGRGRLRLSRPGGPNTEVRGRSDKFLDFRISTDRKEVRRRT